MMTPERQEILDAMEPGHLYSVKAMAGILNKPVTNTQRLMIKLHRDGLLRKVRYGQYERADAPPMEREEVPALAKTPGVYVLRCNDLYKIGWSDNVPTRVAYLMAALPFPATHVLTIPTEDPLTLEQAMHARFADKRVRGEWFALDMFDVDELFEVTH